jgi:hypothetical protein
MKVFLRILVLLLSLTIAVVSLLPPDKEDEKRISTSVAPASAQDEPVPPANETQKVIKDFLGGAALDSGKKAQEKISELNTLREKEFDDAGL